ncbi:MAG: fibrinogen-like YCDxxxxGGGW domain-containing protein [Halomonas sp.]|nr:fibrinogen-like YCDxxxxGGGW domain-containing protein [Halomonas sp.]MDM7481599.1 fibrinogen-like YCDxxxxGGGW domain-containing protein [Halomonas sp.]
MKLPVWRRVGAVVIAFLVCAQPVLTSAQSAVSFQYRQPIRGLIVEGSTQPETETAQLYSSCLELKRAKPYTPSGYYVIYPSGTPAGQTVYCDMDTDGGGWTMWYTTDRYYAGKLASGYINYSGQYGVSGYSVDLRSVPFNEVLYVDHASGEKDWFTRQTQGQIVLGDYVFNGRLNLSGSTFGLWTGKGGANTSYPYQLTVGDNVWMQVGLMMSGYSGGCWKSPDNWCLDTVTNFYRVDGEGNGVSDSNLYGGVAFRTNGHRELGPRLISVGIR